MYADLKTIKIELYEMYSIKEDEPSEKRIIGTLKIWWDYTEPRFLLVDKEGKVIPLSSGIVRNVLKIVAQYKRTIKEETYRLKVT